MKLEEQISYLKQAFGSRETISMAAADRLTVILNQAGEDACEIMVREKIKFVWMPAANRLRNKFGWSQSKIVELIKAQVKESQICQSN